MKRITREIKKEITRMFNEMTPEQKREMEREIAAAKIALPILGGAIIMCAGSWLSISLLIGIL